MAKVGPMFRGARGKAAGLVYFKGRKGTVVRENVVPRNPRTDPQMAQRIIFATVAQAGKAMSSIIDHSFQGVNEGIDSRNKFQSLNVKSLRNYAQKDFEEANDSMDSYCYVTAKDVTALIPNKYIISNGDLAATHMLEQQGMNPSGNLGWGLRGAVTFNITEGLVNSEAVYQIPVADFVSKVLGITSGADQLTFCHIFTINPDEGPLFTLGGSFGLSIYPSEFEADRLVPYNLQGNITWAKSGGSMIAGINAALPRIFGVGAMSPSLVRKRKSSLNAVNLLKAIFSAGSSNQDTSAMTATFTPGNPVSMVSTQYGSLALASAAGIIVSRKVGDSWRYSKCTLETCMPADDIDYGIGWNYGIQAWNQTTEVAGTQQFLNQGGTGGSPT